MKKIVLLFAVITIFFSLVSFFDVYAMEDMSDLLITEITEETEQNDSPVTPEEKEPPCKTEEVVSLEGKTIMMVGNSMLYYGNCVIYGDTGKADKGYFYQLIASAGEEAKVIDHTYTGKTLNYIYDNHLTKLSKSTLESTDYVVLAEANKKNKDLLGTCKKIMALFPEDTKFVFMCNPMIYYGDVEGLYEGVADLRAEKDIIIVDWGKMVYDIFTGAVKVPGSTVKYDFCTFIKDNVYVKDDKGNLIKNPKGGDKKHPNPLSGYLSAQMLYTAVTNRSALYTDYSFCSDIAINERFDIDAFAFAHYTGDKTTNFTDVFRSPADMFGLQRLIDLYLAEEGEHPLYVSEAVEPTCTSGGLSQGYFCSVCKETVKEPEYIQSRGGHKIVYSKAVAPTCTKKGKTGSAYCAVCKQYLIKSQSLNPTGHTNTVILNPATLKRDGKKTLYCTICKTNVSETKIPKIASVTLSKTEYIYDGKSKKPKVTVKASDGKALEPDKHYTVTYPSGRTAVGNYKIKVVFKGKYSGSQTLTFKIRAGVTASVSSKSYLNAVNLTWKKVDSATGYRVYLYNSKTKKYEKYADTKKTTLTVKKLKSGARYKFKVKAYSVVGGKKYFSFSSKYKTEVTKPATVNLKSVLSQSRGQAKLLWKKVSGADGYRVFYSEKKDFKSSVKLTVSGSKATEKTFKGLKSGKKYYFKVRAYKTLSGKKVYGAFSQVKNVNVR